MSYEGRSGALHNPAIYTGSTHISSKQNRDIWVTTKVFFDEFATLSDTKSSPTFSCLGYEWYLKLYPNGSIECDEPEKEISVFLCLQSRGPVKVEYSFSVSDFAHADNKIFQSTSKFVRSKGNENGCAKFLKRELALTFLTEGALVIDVRMRPTKYSSPFLDNPSNQLTVKDFFNDEEYADVVFEVGGELKQQQLGNAKQNKKVKTLSTKFFAHRLIMKKVAPQLAELCLPSQKSPTHIDLPNISPKTFEAVLLHIYGYNIPDLGKDVAFVKDIIEVADKYGIISLKLVAEVCYASKLSLTLENVVEHFLFAESKNCAHLKEKTVDFIIENTAEVTKRNMFTNTAEGPSRSDILAAVARAQAQSPYSYRYDRRTSTELCTMPIDVLRRKAYQKGLDVDGSRETLISALEPYKDEEGDEGNEDEY